MDEQQPLDIFLQPSRRLMLFSFCFVITCGLLIITIPLTYIYKVILFAFVAITILIELRAKVFLTSPNSIIRLGCDGGLQDNEGNLSAQHWWYQRRSGEKVYGDISPASQVWRDWVALDFSRWPWQLGHGVLIARDSVEYIKDFQRLKRMLRSR